MQFSLRLLTGVGVLFFIGVGSSCTSLLGRILEKLDFLSTLFTGIGWGASLSCSRLFLMSS